MSGNPAPFIAAAQKYGSQPAFNQWAQQRYGVSGPVLLAKLAKGESGFNMGAVSSAGARGGTQFMPGTRQDFIRKYNVDPWANPDAAVHATALYLQHDSRGLAGYNPGDPSYTGYILGQKVSGVGGGRAATSARAPRPTSTSSTTTTTTTPGVDNSLTRQALVSQFLQQGGVKSSNASLAFAQGIQGAQDVPATTKTTRVPAAGSAAAPQTTSGSGGLARFDGKPVAGWIAPILERARQTGLWKGTVNSGYRTDQQQTAIYKSGVRPAAVPKSMGGSGSNHEGANFPYGAVDVSDPQGLAAALRKLGVNKLQYAGAKDPVHFSHPHNGGY